MKVSNTILLLFAVFDLLLQHRAEAQSIPQQKKGKKGGKKGGKKKSKKGTKTPGTGGAGSGSGDQKSTIGLALPGGSIPAAIVCGGIMRGFQQKKTQDGNPSIDKFAYTSSLSGGNFPSIMYAYAKNTTSSMLLDADGISDPSEITAKELVTIPKTSMFSRFVIPYDGYIVIALLKVFYAAISEYGTVFEKDLNFWTLFVHSAFLEPFGIEINDTPDRPRRKDAKPTPIAMTTVLGPKELYRDYLSHVNQKHAMYMSEELDSFESVPSLNVSLAPENLLWELSEMSNFQIPLGAFMSPTEFSIPINSHKAIYDPIGNFTAEPINFEPVFSSPDDLQPASEGPFTIAKMLGVGTALIPILVAPLIDAMKEDETLKSLVDVIDQPFLIDVPTQDGHSRSMVLVDGGYNDPNGVPALVQKKVRKIISVEFSSGNEGIFNASPIESSFMGVANYFGVTNDSTLNFLVENPGIFAYQTALPTRHFFDLFSNGENQMLKWLDNMNSLYEAGEPLITTLKDLDVIENKFWGVEGGYKVDLTTIIMYGVPKKFSESVDKVDVAPPPNGKEFTYGLGGFFTNEDLKYVPNLISSSDPKDQVLDVPLLGNITIPSFIPNFSQTVKATRMSEILSSWTITHSWEGLVGADGKKKFEGFSEIFETL